MRKRIAMTPQFSLTFDIVNGHLTFTDTSVGWGTTVQGTFRITHNWVVIYTGTGWHATTPTWVTPPLHGTATLGTNVRAVASIDLAADPNGDPNGDYVFEYWQRTGSGTPVLTTRTYTLAYTAPVVVIDVAVLCSTSELTSEDATDYDIVVDGVSITPTTTTRKHNITAPAGSGFTPVAESADALRTIGGGSTSATRLWTRTWQTNIETALAYTLVASFSTVEPAVYLTDTVFGDDNIFAQCDATICALAQCYANMLTRWTTALTSNFAYREDKRDIVLQATALWAQLQWYERCGTDTQATILALQTLLAGENCNCTAVDDTVSTVIVPWSALAGSGTSASTFVFSYTGTTPAGGNNGDVHYNTATYDMSQKISGSWVVIGNLKGTNGTNGAAGANAKGIIYNNSSGTGTSAGTTEEVLDTYTVQVGDFAADGDVIHVEAIVQLAQNSNEKTINLYLGGTTLATYFTDTAINATNDIVKLEAWIAYDGTKAEYADSMVTSYGAPVPGYASFAMSTPTLGTISVTGHNGTAAAGDIISRVLRIEKINKV